MKIGSISQALQVLQEVRARKEGDGDTGGGGAAGGGNRRKEERPKDENAGKESEFEKALAAASSNNDGQVTQEIERFHHEETAQSNGITATAVGKGPGLRVVLKDAGGRVLRQYSGEEFLKLREAAASDTRGRGKILDQKF